MGANLVFLLFIYISRGLITNLVCSGVLCMCVVCVSTAIDIIVNISTIVLILYPTKIKTDGV